MTDVFLDVDVQQNENLSIISERLKQDPIGNFKNLQRNI